MIRVRVRHDEIIELGYAERIYVRRHVAVACRTRVSRVDQHGLVVGEFDDTGVGLAAVYKVNGQYALFAVGENLSRARPRRRKNKKSGGRSKREYQQKSYYVS